MKNITKNLLTIGELASFSNSSIKALRYYEKIGILTPFYINGKTKYRYYSHKQIDLVYAFQLCVELDIPLKELKQFVVDNELINYATLLSYSKEIAHSKFAKLQETFKFIDHAEQELIISDNFYNNIKTYHRKFDNQLFLITEYKELVNNEDWYKFTNTLNDSIFLDSSMSFSFTRSYGILYEYQNGIVNRHLFVEIPIKYTEKKLNDTLYIPKGTYLCYVSNEPQIHDILKVFNNNINNTDSFLFIESYLSSSNGSSEILKETRLLLK